MGPFDRRLLRRADGVRSLLAVDAVAGVLGTLLLLVQATVLAAALAGVVGGSGVSAVALAALGALVAVRAALAVVVERTGRRASSRVMSSLRTELVARRLRVSGAGGDPDAAATATAAVQGVDGLEVYFAKYLPQLVLAVLVPAAVLVWTAVVDPTSAVIMLVTLPVIPVFLWLIGVATAAKASANLAALESLAGQFLDVLRGLPTLRAFNRGRAQVPRIVDATERYRRTTMGVLRVSFLSGAVLDMATTLSIALVAVTLGARLVGGSLELRPALTVLLLVPELYAPIRAVGTLFHASADGLAGARRILDALDEEDATGSGPVPDARLEPDGRQAEAEGRRAAGVALRGVAVTFAGRPVPALDGVELEVAPGEVVAVVGPSGAGKTTLGRLLLGLLVPDTGMVEVDGAPLTVEARERWRHRVAWASQRPALVHGSVARNIALGAPAPDAAVVEAAARRAGVHELVASLPDGYATVIGPAGRGLSAGQRQRIGLARALARAADLVVLDEPTAHLDTAGAAVVATAVERLRGQATVVVLTHDAALASVADRVVRLDAGRLSGPLATPAAATSGEAR